MVVMTPSWPLRCSRSVVGGGDPPGAVFRDDEVGHAVGGDDLEAGESAVTVGIPPVFVERPWAGPAGHGLGWAAADSEGGRRGADLAAASDRHDAAGGVEQLDR